MKLIATAIALATIFSTKVNSLELLSANTLELDTANQLEQYGKDDGLIPGRIKIPYFKCRYWDIWIRQHTCEYFHYFNHKNVDAVVATCDRAAYPTLTTDLTLSCGPNAS